MKILMKMKWGVSVRVVHLELLINNNNNEPFSLAKTF